MKRFLTMLVVGLMLAVASVPLLARGRGRGRRGPKGPRDGSCNQSSVINAQDEVQDYRGGRRRGPGDGTGPICECGEFLDEDGDGLCDICGGDCDGNGPGADGPKGDGDGECDGDGPKGPRRGRG